MDMRQILKYLADLSENNNWEWYRAYRMENDRSPLNPSFRAHISSKGKQPVPVGYYLMIKSGGQSFLTRINRKSFFAFPPNFKYNKENYWRMCSCYLRINMLTK